MHTLALVVLSALVVSSVTAGARRGSEGAADDPLLGTWHLNVSKSTYRPGAPPVAQIRTYEKHTFGIRATVKTVHADGRTTTVQSIYDYDRQEHPVTGSEDTDSIVVTRMSANRHEATLSHAGMEVGRLTREISKDGSVMTVTLQRRTPPVYNVEVYQKVAEPDQQ